ncbi:hypothetical protein NDU88_000952 [Pleurodeles waltl]|uniref:Uncharacterized protein n=1 Tax=Pleurodeles waltl TaxID=8319 RepID=A0AAV7MIC0_PLEWA|nr:hypothetical protein NDU88_000952 [Pleurodeles waltl]
MLRYKHCVNTDEVPARRDEAERLRVHIKVSRILRVQKLVVTGVFDYSEGDSEELGSHPLSATEFFPRPPEQGPYLIKDP